LNILIHFITIVFLTHKLLLSALIIFRGERKRLSGFEMKGGSMGMLEGWERGLLKSISCGRMACGVGGGGYSLGKIITIYNKNYNKNKL
jgi:hypothetical protein